MLVPTTQTNDIYIEQPNTSPEIVLEMGEKGPLRAIENFCRVLEGDERISGSICYNELAHRRWVRGFLPWEPAAVDRPWTDSDDAWLRRWMWVNYKLKGKDDLDDAVQIAQSLVTINPVREYLDSLQWDGKSRISTMLSDYLGAELSKFNAAVLRVFVLGAVARIYQPGTKFDYCMILTGPQGCGKSTFLSRLAIRPEWFNDGLSTMSGDKNRMVEQLSGRFILELGELAALKRTSDIESVKQFITATFDVHRAPYARYEEQRPRMCVIAGTTNSISFLVDKTGGRRFLPVEVGKQAAKKNLFDKACKEDFDQLWAEAVSIYKSGQYSLTLDKEMEIEAEDRRSGYQEEDSREGIIQEWLDTCGKDLVCVPMIYEQALGEMGKPTRRISNELHEIMRSNKIIQGWSLHPSKNGKARCGKYGFQICYVRDDSYKYAPSGKRPVELL